LKEPILDSETEGSKLRGQGTQVVGATGWRVRGRLESPQQSIEDQQEDSFLTLPVDRAGEKHHGGKKKITVKSSSKIWKRGRIIEKKSSCPTGGNFRVDSHKGRFGSTPAVKIYIERGQNRTVFESNKGIWFHSKKN